MTRLLVWLAAHGVTLRRVTPVVGYRQIDRWDGMPHSVPVFGRAHWELRLGGWAVVCRPGGGRRV